ncbi:hypothetical protein PPERSA_02997 [Pseudocohnilembus persalinus]|uniref:Uncharacterized protein n=1 Tax=Pseudocohnilembus persalinus TaxID=266149 RepID=A0A0V0QEU8_PSEPJ|nr:hypothetical protein PPERSA_02997 [Pseudocohnilembus persalinus]|eukprot:KRX00737.1 hypothetical protein PPERSA_02997 [Pseudocohnilembus persalinus]
MQKEKDQPFKIPDGCSNQIQIEILETINYNRYKNMQKNQQYKLQKNNINFHSFTYRDVLNRSSQKQTQMSYISDPDLKPRIYHQSALVIAQNINSYDLIYPLYVQQMKIDKLSYKYSKEEFLTKLSNIPDFFLEIDVKCDSKVLPLVPELDLKGKQFVKKTDNFQSFKYSDKQQTKVGKLQIL